MRILLIEDNKLLVDKLCTYFTQERNAVYHVEDGQSALHVISIDWVDLIVMDLSLRNQSGSKLLRTLRQQKTNLPIFTLASNQALPDERIQALKDGADDCLSRPFDMPELAMRLRALHRRANRHFSSIMYSGEIQMDVDRRRVMRKGREIILSRREFALLEALLEKGGHVLTRDYLECNLYGWKDGVDSNALEVHIHNLRKKLGKKLIRTFRGLGYAIDRTPS